MEDRKPLEGWEVLSTSQKRLLKEVDCRRGREVLMGSQKFMSGVLNWKFSLDIKMEMLSWQLESKPGVLRSQGVRVSYVNLESQTY